MKIGIISDVLNFKLTGIGNYTFQLIKGLNKTISGNKPILINYTTHKLDLPNPNCLINNPFPINRTYFWYPYLTFKLAHHDFDIIHNPSQVPAFFRFPQPSVMTMHDITTFIVPGSHDFITRINDRFLLKKTLTNVNCIISDSYKTKEDLIRVFHLPSEKIFVIHIAVDPTFKPLNQIQSYRSVGKISIPEKFILYTGTLEKRKNLLTLIQAFYALKKEGIPHKLVLAGKCGNVKSELEILLRNLKLSKDVIFTGYIPVEDLLYLYNKADVFVYLSYYEGFGLPPLEAMACGCPVVCSNSSSLPEVVGDAGILVNPQSIEEVKNSIKKIINDPELREIMSQRSIERSLLFSWEKCARETYKVYKIAAGDS